MSGHGNHKSFKGHLGWNVSRNTGRKKNGEWHETNETFVNPYNFVSLGSRCERFDIRQYNHRNDLLTGVIECTLETKTPIFIPNPTNQNAFGHPKGLKTLDFYSYKNLNGTDHDPDFPVIPASEIRGVIRAAYEAVTDSCMSTIDVNRKLYKRTTVPGKPGILKKENGKWNLYPAERVMLKTKECKDDPFPIRDIKKYKEGERVYILKSKQRYKNKNFYPFMVEDIKKEKEYDADLHQEYQIGFVHKGEPFIRKHHESVFLLDNTKEAIKLSDNDVERLLIVHQLYNDTEEDKGKKYSEFELNEHGTLVYFVKRNNIYYLSPACISKELFSNSLEKILETQGGYQPCTSRKAVCPTCALFGMVSNQDRLASRLRFTDAHVCAPESQPSEYYLSLKVLDELSNPKLSTTEFYLENPGTDIWNYDYAGNWNKGKLEVMKDYQPKIRGRKFYWHWKSEPKWQDYIGKNDENLHKRNCVIRPLKKGVRFTFRVYFEQISEEDLKRLIWTLNIGRNENSHCHKIGMGKPLGLGSVKIKVNQVKIRKIDLLADTISYKEVNVDYNRDELEQVIKLNTKHVQEFLKITDLGQAPMNISYPKAVNLGDKNPDAGYQWFVGNRSINTSATQPKVYRSLPHILDQKIELRGLIKKNDKNPLSKRSLK